MFQGGVCLYLLLELVHESVLLPLERHHFLLGFLAVVGGQLQQGDVGVLLTDGRQQSLLPVGGGKATGFIPTTNKETVDVDQGFSKWILGTLWVPEFRL